MQYCSHNSRQLAFIGLLLENADSSRSIVNQVKCSFITYTNLQNFQLGCFLWLYLLFQDVGKFIYYPLIFLLFWFLFSLYLCFFSLLLINYVRQIHMLIYLFSNILNQMVQPHALQDIQLHLEEAFIIQVSCSNTSICKSS